jgi:competence protein ComEA
LSLSSATVEQLDTLDGIGPTLAARIVQYREAHGGFRSIDELRQVDGIGEKRFESLRKGLQP